MFTIDVFGRPLLQSEFKSSSKGPPGIGFKLTSNGDYDLDAKRLTNASDAVDDNDLVTKKSTLTFTNQDTSINVKKRRLVDLAEPVDPLDACTRKYVDTVANKWQSRGLLLNNHVYDAKSKRISNVAAPVDNDDSVTKRYFYTKALTLADHQYDAKNKRIAFVGNPIEDGDAIHKKYFDNQLVNILKLIDTSTLPLKGYIAAQHETLSTLSSEMRLFENSYLIFVELLLLLARNNAKIKKKFKDLKLEDYDSKKLISLFASFTAHSAQADDAAATASSSETSTLATTKI